MTIVFILVIAVCVVGGVAAVKFNIWSASQEGKVQDARTKSIYNSQSYIDGQNAQVASALNDFDFQTRYTSGFKANDLKTWSFAQQTDVQNICTDLSKFSDQQIKDYADQRVIPLMATEGCRTVSP